MRDLTEVFRLRGLESLPSTATALTPRRVRPSPFSSLFLCFLLPLSVLCGMSVGKKVDPTREDVERAPVSSMFVPLGLGNRKGSHKQAYYIQFSLPWNSNRWFKQKSELFINDFRQIFTLGTLTILC